MLEKEFKDDKDKLVSSVCKYDSSSGNLSYCGTICLQMNDEAVLKPTTEFFNMILYNSDPNSKVYLRRFLNSANVTKVSPQDDIEGINNFDIFVIQVRKFCHRTGNWRQFLISFYRRELRPVKGSLLITTNSSSRRSTSSP